MTEVYCYYKLHLRLLTEQLGTCTKASIYDEHVLKKAQKMIKEANKQGSKLLKAYEKYKGTPEIPPQKELAELQGIIRRYEELLGQKSEMPTDAEGVLEYAKTLEEDFEEKINNNGERQATIFMRNKEGKVQVSTHMILGNLKENARIITNNSIEGAPKIFKYKTSVNESLSLDVKPIENFMYPNQDIIRDEKGNPKLLERPIRFDRMGKIETAIALSEVLPAGTEYSVVHLRVRIGSVLTQEVLESLFELGKNNGLGQWRGSGKKGTYQFKLEPCENPITPDPEGWR